MAKDQPGAEGSKSSHNDNDEERLAQDVALERDREALKKARNGDEESSGSDDNAGDYANLHFGEQNLEAPDGFIDGTRQGATVAEAVASSAGDTDYANEERAPASTRATPLNELESQVQSYRPMNQGSPEETTEGEAFEVSALSQTPSRILAPDAALSSVGPLEGIQNSSFGGAIQTRPSDDDEGAGQGGDNGDNPGAGNDDSDTPEPQTPPQDVSGEGGQDPVSEGGDSGDRDGDDPVVEEPAENNAPVDIVLSGGPVFENVGGAFVADLSAVDPDAGDLAVFSIVYDPSGLFELAGDVLKLKDGAAFDFETQTAHDVTLRVTDGAGASYEETVTIDVANVNEAPVVDVVPQSGLRASYYNIGHALSDLDQVNFNVAPTVEGVVDSLNYMTGGQAFWDGAPSDYFAAKYEGRLLVEEGGTYTFDMASDDGSMLFIDGVAVLDNDGLHSTRTRSVTLDLEAGPHEIEVRYFENGGSQTLQLAWSGPDTGGVTEVIGGSSFEHGASVDGLTIADDEAGVIVARLSVSDPDMGDTHFFSVSDDRFEVVEEDGGAYLKLKDGVSIDYEGEPSLNVDVTVTDAGGASSTINLPITVENTNHAPSISLIGGEGLHASYYNVGHSLSDLDQVNFDAAPTAEGVVESLNYMGGQEAFWDGAPRDYFAAKYEGQLMVDEGGTYTFHMASDDGSMLFIDGVAVLDNDGLHSTRTRSVTLDLDSGSHEIEVRYFENGGSQTLQLAWSGPDTGGVTEIIGGESFRLPGFDDADRLGLTENAAGDVAARFTVSDAEGDVVSLVASDERFEVLEDGDSYILKLKDGVEVNYETESEISVTVTATDEHGEATAYSFDIPVLNMDEAPVNFTLAPSVHGGHLSLNQDGGVDDAAIAANLEAFPTDALTVEVRFSSDQTDVGDGTPLFSYAASDGSDNEALIWLEGSSGKMNIFLAGQKINTGVSNASLLDGEEHQVSFTWDQTSKELKVYIDGDTAFETSINIRDLKSGGTLSLGQEQDSEGGGFVTNQVFEGEIAEVRIFDYARSEAEITNHTGAPIGDPETEPGLVNNWVMNAGEGGFIEDLAGADNLQLVNDAHVDGGEAYLTPTVLENRPGAVAGVLSADDPNTGAAVTTFSIVSDPSAAFEIDGNVLKLKDGVSLDHETQASYEIAVEATGPDGETTQQTFTVSVADENEAPVDFALDPVSAVKVLSLNQDGEGDAAAVASNLESFPTDALTVEVRFSSDQTDVGNGAPLFSYAANDGSHNEVLLFLEGASGNLNVFLAGQKVDTGVANESLLDGDEHQVSVSWDQASNELKVYIDGDSAFETSINIRDLKAGGALSFGQEQDSEGGGFDSGQVFEGEIAEVRIFDYARSETEIADHAGEAIENPDTEPGLINNWVMNAEDGGVIEDLVGADDLQLINGATVQNSGSSSTPLVSENESGAVVGTLSARDRLSGEAISEFAIADDPSGLFEIEGGQLKLKDGEALDYEAQQSHEVIVEAIAANGETTQLSVTVQVADLTATDISLTLAESARLTDAVIVNGEISTTNGGGSDTAQVELPVGAAESAAITISFASIDNSFELIVNGQSLSGQTVQLQSNVYDASNQAFLQFGDGTAMTSPWIANDNGAPRLIANVTSDGVEILATRTPSSGVYEPMTIINGEFVAPMLTDGVNTVTIVNPDDDGPDGLSAVITAQYEDIVEGPLSGEEGAVVGNLSALDADGAPSFSIVDDASGLFEISGDQLKVKDGMSLDYETQASHEITIQVIDENGAGHQETLTINVQEESTASQHLYGDTGDNILAGGAGDDVIYGGAGNDTITGSAGDDVMFGGDGSDVFVYEMGDGSDQVAGGAGWTDVINLADGSAPLGEFGTDWTVELTHGSISSATDGSVIFTDDAAGAITLSDGSVLNFSEIEQLTY